MLFLSTWGIITPFFLELDGIKIAGIGSELELVPSLELAPQVESTPHFESVH